MSSEIKNKVYTIRKSLERGEDPTVATVHWLLDTIIDLKGKYETKAALLANSEQEIEDLRVQLIQFKDKVVSAINNVVLDNV